jgi:hypothetical protein
LQIENERPKQTNEPTNTELPKFELEVEENASLSMLCQPEYAFRVRLDAHHNKIDLMLTTTLDAHHN